VNGTGSALTFSEAATATGTFNYTVQTIDATGVQCEMPVSNTRGITVNGVPGVPTMSGGGSQCGGTRSITASAGSGGAGIRWTDNSSTAATRDVGTGTYYAVTTSTAGCESAQASVAVTINAVPANPTVTAASRCGTGTVALRASSSGAVIDWYSASSGGTSLTTSNTYTTSSLTATATYYAQARSTSAGSCTSAARTAVTATVNTVPSVTLSSGSNNQSVNAGTAIGTIKYTASNATTIYRSGTLPTNVSSSVTSNTTLSIYGTPSVTGTFTYSVSSSHTNGCVSSTTLAGTITVNAASSFSSSTTWSYGGLTWSDRVVGPSACNKSNFSNDYTALNCRSYTGSDGVLRYYYNWPYVNANKSTMCPSPWRVPTQSDFNTLVSNTDATTLINIWGYGGLASLTSILYSDTNSRYWSSMELDRTTAYCLYYDSNKVNVSSSGRDYGEQVRCVK
jgi:hypothetical protein